MDTDLLSFVGEQAISDTITNRIVNAPAGFKYGWPELLRDPDPHWSVYSVNNVFVLYFLNYDLLRLTNQFQHTKYGSLPGLIKVDSEFGCMAGLSNSRNSIFSANFAPGMYLLDVGADSTAVIQSHSIDITLPQFGRIRYTIPIAYLVSTGPNISPYDIPQKLDELIAYTVKNWLGEKQTVES